MSTSEHQHEAFSLPLFAVTVVLTLVGLYSLLWLVAPSLWEHQLNAGLWSFLAAFVGVSFVDCFVEYFFHRYMLHRPVVPGFARLYRQHTLHHALTRISRKPSRDGRGLLFVENKFPIVEPEQGEGSFFPWYSLAVFAGLSTPFLLLMQWFVPALPWLLAGYAAVAVSLTLYELLHAINHWPLETWMPLIEHPRWGRIWRLLYSFHLRHHAVIDCNESISGFFGIPVADWLFGTCLIPKTIYADGEEWKQENFIAPKACRLIRWLDGISGTLVQTRRSEGNVSTSLENPSERGLTKGEKIAQWLTHGVGAAFSVAALTLLIVFASLRGNVWHVVSFTVFGVCLLVLYTASPLGQISRSARLRWLFGRLNQAAVFLLIAGTLTPFFLTNLRGNWGWSLFAAFWGFCGMGAVFKFIGSERFRAVSVIATLYSVWLIIVAIKPLLSSVPAPGLWLLLAGGLCYVTSIAFHAWQNLRYRQVFRYSFVLSGSTCHFLAVLLFLTPQSF